MIVNRGAPGVVVAGDSAGLEAMIFAEDAGWPLFAEPSSGARVGSHALRTYRPLLSHSHLSQDIDHVVVFGHPTLSRPVNRLLSRDDVEVIVIGADFSHFPDQPERARLSLLPPVLEGSTDPAWVAQWRDHDAAAALAVDALVDRSDELTPHFLARSVAEALPAGGLLYVGASSPIRDLDLMAGPWPFGERRQVLANRGLAGIDGTISSAIGAALATSPTQALAYIGDLTFLHDSNALVMGPGEPRPSLRIVIASDNGGAIFSLLEQGDPAYAHEFDRVFGTPTRTDIATLCAAHDIAHCSVHGRDSLVPALTAPQQGIDVVEVHIGRADRREQARQFDEAIAAALARPIG